MCLLTVTLLLKLASLHIVGAEIDEYEIDDAACSVRLLLRLLEAGRVDVLEQAIVHLLEMV